jgi:3-methylfumaryl-CoA hydratase
MGAWDAWIGREELRGDRVDEGLYARWLATLDRAAPGDGAVPQGLHWCLCTPDAPTARLGPDGHPLRDDSPLSFLPPVPLPRRMWASSKLAFLAPLHPDEAVTRTSRVLSVAEKTGGSGQLVFVEVEHETCGEAGPAVREVQSLVYRAAAEPGTPPAPPPLGDGRFDPGQWAAHRMLVPSEALLFRYSALTFNSHRIHYDAPYAMGEENYRGLVVHGPLTATLLLDLAQRELGDNALGSFAFRGLSPAICGEELHLVMRPAEGGHELGAFAADGRQVMSAQSSTKGPQSATEGVQGG